MDRKSLLADNEKLVEQFGAHRMPDHGLPDFYTFNKGLVHSHRDFPAFFAALKKGEKCAIVSGFNASGTIHLGHKPLFDTILYFQKEYGLQLYVPISDDESYITGKVETQEQAKEYSLQLVREMLAYGFDPKKTHFIIDQVYTNIYNLAVKLCRRVTYSEIKATYGYKNEDNPGMYFYPAVQSAHILFPQEHAGIKNVLVPIGPDEDSHIRLCRDIAKRAKYHTPSILHMAFMPGIDGEKMSKSRSNAIFLKEDESSIRKKVRKAFSGGAVSAEEQRKHGGKPENDVSILYLTIFFLDEEAGKALISQYKEGKILSGEVKEMLADKLVEFTQEFQEKIKKVSDADVQRSILKNED
jgi:tryptophanyl-tRNA synthetase